MTSAQPLEAVILDQWLSDFRHVEDTHPITTQHAARVMSAWGASLAERRALRHEQLEQERAAGLVCGKPRQ